MKRPLPLLIPFVAMFFSPLLFGQQSGDAQATQPEDNVDIVTQVQQLRAEVEQLSEQVDRLNNEIKTMRSTGTAPVRAARSRTAPAPQVASVSAPAIAPVTTAPASAQSDESIPITVLVFRDGRKVETRNYAIVGESIWVYNEQESKKYRVADLDVDATRKLNSDNGVLFQLPPAR